jgi:glycosyltransferase involved in cell wall biosynthesis
MSTPSVSVVIPVRDTERYLGEALTSILAQTRPVDEIVVVDDGSTDGTVAIARSFGDRVSVIERPARGPGAARNDGITAASGELIALCDADDVWLPHRIERQLELIDDTSAAVAVFCGVDEFVSPELAGREAGVREPQTGLRQVRLSSALLATRSVFDLAGPFGTSPEVSDWADWSIRMTSAVDEIRFHPDILVRRRLHDRNVSRERRPPVALSSALAAHLRRRRAASP